MRNSTRQVAVRRRPLRAMLLAGAACAVASGAIAQIGGTGGAPTAPLRLKSDYFGYAAAVSPRVSYSDNIELAPDGLEEDALILSNMFTGAAIYSTSRFTGIVSGDLDLSLRTDNTDFSVNQRLGGASTLTVADNALYVDFAGSTSRQLLGDNARFSQNINAARSQRADVHSYSVSPYIYHEFTDRSNAQLRYRFSQIFIDDDNAGANPFGGDFLNDSRSQEVIASYNTGNKFERLKVGVSAYGNRTVEDGSLVIPRFEFEQGSVTGEALLSLTPTFGISGAIGYDEVSTDGSPGIFNDDALSGFFWRAGFTARPGRRSLVRVEYGRRYNDDFIDASASYEISDRLTFAAGASQTFETRAQSISSQFINQQRQTLEFADRLREGAELSPEAVIATANRFANTTINAQTSGVGVSKSAFMQLNGAYDRTEMAITASYQDTDFGFRQNETLGVNFDVRRELSRRLSGYAGVFYRRSESMFDQATCQTSPFLFGFDVTAPLFDPVMACFDFAIANGLTNTVGGRVGAAYRLYENLSIFGEYAHTNRWADSAILEYDENAFLAGLTLDF